MKIAYSTISSKGQVVIPAELRQEMSLKEGTRVSLAREGDSLVLRPITPQFIHGLRGVLKGKGSAIREREHKDEDR